MTLSRFMEAEKAINGRLDAVVAQQMQYNESLQDLQQTLSLFMDEQIRLQEEQTKKAAEIVKDHTDMLKVYQGFKATVHVLGILERLSVAIVKLSGAVLIVWGTWKLAVERAIESIKM
jgi:hypothetical protein